LLAGARQATSSHIAQQVHRPPTVLSSSASELHFSSSSGSNFGCRDFTSSANGSNNALHTLAFVQSRESHCSWTFVSPPPRTSSDERTTFGTVTGFRAIIDLLFVLSVTVPLASTFTDTSALAICWVIFSAFA